MSQAQPSPATQPPSLQPPHQQPFVPQSLGTRLTMPWSPSSFSARQFVKIDPAHQNATQWRVDKLQELSVVNVTAALIASVVSGAFSWPMVDEAPWTAKASFYSTLFISLSAVAAGAQQSIALDRYGQHPEGIRQLQELLRGGSSGSVSWLQLYVWQLPIMLLNISIVLFLVGILILIWARAAHSAAWDDDMKIAFVASLAGLAGLVNYVIGATALYWRYS